MLFVIIGVIIGIPVLLLAIGASISAPTYRGPTSDHFDGKTFVNPGNVKAKGGMDVVRWMISRDKKAWDPLPDTVEAGKRPLAFYKDGIRITFVNHSTFLIQVGGLNILTDPVWSKRVSPFSRIGPKRMRPPGIRFEDLPRIHVVVLSHNHYDHLDIETMKLIFGAHHPRIIVPLGVKSFFEDHMITGVTEHDWWEEASINSVLGIQLVPAQHFSGRGLLDRDATLWCGFVFKTISGNIYYAGDTGYNETTFKTIGQKFAPVRVALIPIGAYRPAWFMSPIHVSPEEAVKIHMDVQPTVSIAAHFGTFPLADEGRDDPQHDLAAARAKYGLSEDMFVVLTEGDAMIFED